MLKYILLTIVVIQIVASRQLFSQISIAPVSLFIYDPINVASLQILNGYDTPREISVDFKFGYLSSDSAGNQIMIYKDSLASSEFGLDKYLYAFPRKFVLPPGTSQIVRVQVRNFFEKPDGVYWSRIIISSGEIIALAGKPLFSDNIETKVNYIFDHNIAVFYRKGEVSTKLVPEKVTTKVKDGKLQILACLSKEGNSPFNGSVEARLRNSDNREVAFYRQTTVVYFDLVQKIELELPEGTLSNGNYELELVYQTKRQDIASADLVQADPVCHNVGVIIE